MRSIPIFRSLPDGLSRRPPSRTSLAAGRRALLAGLLAAVAAAAQASDAAGPAAAASTIEAIERLAGKRPAEAEQVLAAWRRSHPSPALQDSLLADLAEIEIASSRYEASLVLQKCEALQRRLAGADVPRIHSLMENARGSAYYQLGRFDLQHRAIEEAAHQAELAHDDNLLALAIVNRTRYFMHAGDFEAAARALSEALSLAHGPEARAEASYAATILDKNIGDWTQEIEHARETKRAFEEVNDITGIADSLYEIGGALVQLKRAPEAIVALEEAHIDYTTAGDRNGEALVDLFLARAHAMLGDAATAASLSRSAVTRLREQEDFKDLGAARVNHATILIEAGRPEEALRELGEVDAAAAGRGEILMRQSLHEARARALHAIGDERRAYLEMDLARAEGSTRVDQLVTRQLAAQRGRIEFERLMDENGRLRSSVSSSQEALQSERRANAYESLALVLGALLAAGVALAAVRQRALAQRLSIAAQTDSLTGLLNRRAFFASGEPLLARNLHDLRPCALLMIDVDHFKRINDAHGHAEGDQALQRVAVSIKNMLRPVDVLSRIGGEEFAILLTGTDLAGGRVTAERIRAAVENDQPLVGGGVRLTVSVGIAVSRGDGGDSLEQLLTRADRALYRAKNAGRNRVELEEALPLAPVRLTSVVERP